MEVQGGDGKLKCWRYVVIVVLQHAQVRNMKRRDCGFTQAEHNLPKEVKTVILDLCKACRPRVASGALSQALRAIVFQQRPLAYCAHGSIGRATDS